MTDFPYAEIRTESGDYFASVSDAKDAGFSENQIWSVGVHEDTWVYGPPHHYVNVIGYVATKETHDNDTYFEEEDTPCEPY